MSTSPVPLVELLRKAGIEETDFLRDAVEGFLQPLMEAEVPHQIGAAPPERTATRTHQRNGYRPRTWNTRVGTVHLAIPKLRHGTYFPEFREPRRRSEQALVSVIQEAYVHGVSTRKVDQLVQALGMKGMSKSEVSALCRGLDARVQAFRQRPLEGQYPYVWLDAQYLKVREGDRVLSMALVVATGVNLAGDREVLGCDLGRSEDAAFWTAFLRDLRDRGLRGGNWSSATPIRDFRPLLPRCSRAPPGNGVGGTLCAISWPTCPNTPRRWWPPGSARSLRHRTKRPPGPSCAGSRTTWPTGFRRRRPAGRTPKTTCWPI